MSTELLERIIPSKEQIEKLQAEMVKMPQAELETEHYFSEGMYCRKLTRPAGTLIVGKVHKKPHFFLCAKGEIIAWTESGMRTLKAELIEPDDTALFDSSNKLKQFVIEAQKMALKGE